MNLSKLFVPAAAAALLLGGISASQAQTFTYTEMFVIHGGPGGDVTVSSPSSIILLGTNSGMGSAGSFTVTPQQDLTGNTLTPIFPSTNIRVGQFNPTFTGDASTVTNFANTIDLTIFLTSNAETKSFVYNGIGFAGNLGNSNDSVVFTNIPTASITQTVGGNPFTVVVNSFTNPGTSNATPNPNGTLGGTVTSTPAPVPEPSSIAMLVGMGVSGSAFVLRRRRAGK